MSLRFRPRVLRFAASAVLISLGALGLGRAQAPGGDDSVTGAGLQILQGLTPEQRDAISQQMGGGIGTGSLGGQSGTRARGADQLQQQDDLNRQNEQREQIEAQKAEIERLSPYLKAEDWIIVTIDFNPLPPPVANPNFPQLGNGVNNGANAQIRIDERCWAERRQPAAKPADHREPHPWNVTSVGSCGGRVDCQPQQRADSDDRGRIRGSASSPCPGR